MAWIKVESSVARNRKFVKAGPGPSWLWLCGLAYCQEGLTDGFIPTEAIDYLGVKSARHLARHLVSAGLWDVIEGGWQVHDYLEHNKPASEVRRIQADRRDAGANGGKASGEARRHGLLPQIEANAKQTANPATATAITAATNSYSGPLDVAFAAFQAAYPSIRRKGGRMVQDAYITQVNRAGHPDVLLTALESHKTSEQWQTPKLVPGMDTWLNEERWRQTLPAASGAAVKKPWGTWRPAEAK